MLLSGVSLCSHYPQLRSTAVASTPEQDRIKQLTQLNSMVSLAGAHRYIRAFYRTKCWGRNFPTSHSICPTRPLVNAPPVFYPFQLRTSNMKN